MLKQDEADGAYYHQEWQDRSTRIVTYHMSPRGRLLPTVLGSLGQDAAWGMGEQGLPSKYKEYYRKAITMMIVMKVLRFAREVPGLLALVSEGESRTRYLFWRLLGPTNQLLEAVSGLRQ